MHVAICAVELYCYKNPMSRKLSQSTLIWLLDSLGLSVSTLGTMTITLDFLKSSSRGGPRVPRPLLSSASRPKFFTRYSTVPSFATFKKSHAPPSFRPPLFAFTHTSSCFACRIIVDARQMVPRTTRRLSHTSCPGALPSCSCVARARHPPRPLAHSSLMYPHVRTERCCLVLHCAS